MAFGQVGQVTGTALQGLQGMAVGAPVKEIGFLQRAEGLSSGLMELHERLERLSAKINSHPVADDKARNAIAGGLDGSLTAAEGALRACFDAITRIDGQF